MGRLAALDIARASSETGAINQREQGDGTNQIRLRYRLNETSRDLEHGEQVGTGAYSITPILLG